jgi:hypothetical protein
MKSGETVALLYCSYFICQMKVNVWLHNMGKEEIVSRDQTEE